MNVRPISNNNLYVHKYNAGINRAKNVSFTHHPDFENFEKVFEDYYYQTAVYRFDPAFSTYFRRGNILNKDYDNDFNKVQKAFEDVWMRTDKPKMLVVGIGRSQEPFSYLTMISELAVDKKLEDCIDMHIVDLQSMPDRETLFKDSFYDRADIPRLGLKGFVYDDRENAYRQSRIFPDNKSRYRVNDELFEYLWNTYSNTEKSKWETRIQEAIKEYPKESFDIISINNVIPWIRTQEDRVTVMKDCVDCLKSGGVLVTDPYAFPFGEIDYFNNDRIINDCKKMGDGLYVKKD